ncbi:MAG: flavin reductase family protein [Oscillospiraceae bacterium]|nr:flavin reductase family protein [Oscillospiraceae bacterium]
MKKNLGSKPALFPMPVTVVSAYDAFGVPNAMTAAWVQISDMDKIALFVDPDHKTMKNILETKAFTVAIADVEHMAEADFIGIASGNTMEDKLGKSGLHTVKSEFVNAPVIEEFPVSLDCELVDIIDSEHAYAMIGKIVNTSVEETVIGEDGKVDPEKIHALIFDQFRNGYYAVGEKVGRGWNAGMELMKKAKG